MAASSGRKPSASRSNNSKRRTANKSRSANKSVSTQKERELFHEIGLIIFLILMVLLFLCNFGIIGSFGSAISGFLFGCFGLCAYIVPILLFIAVGFWYANSGNPNALRKLIAGIVLFLMVGVLCELISGNGSSMEKYDAVLIYKNSSAGKNGGGIFAGSLAYLLHSRMETIGTVLVVILCSAVSFILMTEKSLLSGVKRGGTELLERSREDSERRRDRREEQEELRAQRALEKEEQRVRREEERRKRAEKLERARSVREEERARRAEEKENEKILRIDKRVTGVAMDTTIPRPEKEQDRRSDDMHEITWDEEETSEASEMPREESAISDSVPNFDFNSIRIRSAHQVNIQEVSPVEEPKALNMEPSYEQSAHEKVTLDHPAFTAPSAEPSERKVSSVRDRPAAKPVEEKPHGGIVTPSMEAVQKELRDSEKKCMTEYKFPPLNLLKKGEGNSADTTNELRDTAMRLQQTLNNFGVKVTITDISQGPSVTRYELQPEQGVKVSKIVSLSDDIKLNLAAADIRIEAPIPGKAAIGIEVPNRENKPVALRELLESNEFKSFSSNIAFAVGKDISGQVVVADIAKMPHMLIAGATGSGKSVCINTLIMSILYKAHPDDVKLILVDPKVVELSVYNGIPHLLIPVVTDPKKASAALNWGVSEMMDRYKKFADFNVRDLKGYNKKLETMRQNGETDVPVNMPQIVIIVDELADLMMVSPGEVEEAICRLAQLARAAGIHLVIATQRPSVDVITGLIKANMPSRVAFSVSSGVDSRTILDMNGAEKLLGKGDMLFYPQGYSKPARVQGAFVSDKEVSDVVDFLKNQVLGNVYSEDVEEKLKSMGTSGGSTGAGGGSSLDEYFTEAGRFIIGEDKGTASVGRLQRKFKIGFNRAARIMDQLCEYGVVGEEEGTKPRKVLMSMEQFEQLIEEIV